MAYLGLYNADGQIHIQTVSGVSYTGLYSADGCYNGVLDVTPAVLKGSRHSCGAFNIQIVSDPYAGAYAADGARNVIADNFGGYTFTPLRAGSSVAIIPAQGWGAANKLQGVYPFDTAYNNHITAYETWLGASVNHVLAFSAGPDWANIVTNTSSQVTSILPNSKPIFWSLCTPAGSTLAALAAGAYDSSLTSIANAYLAARPGDTIIPVRVFQEFQNIANPWTSVGVEANYIAAFRHVTQLFLAISLKFRFIWCPNQTTSVAGTPYDPTQAYPGDNYVDVIAQDVYYLSAFEGTNANAAWRLKLNDTYGLNWISNFARTHNKPLAIPEWGFESDTASAFVSGMAEWTQASNLAYVTYFNANNGANFQNQLDTGNYPTSGVRFINEFASPTKTNLFTAGKDFSNAAWAKTNVTVVTGQTDPDSGTSAQSLFETVTNAQHYAQQTATKDSSPHVYRVYARAKPINTRNFARIQVQQNSFADGESMYFDLANANAGSFFNYGAMGAPTLFAFPDTNGFVKIGGEFISSSATDLFTTLQAASADGTDSYTGDITKGLVLYDAWIRELPLSKPIPVTTNVFVAYSLRSLTSYSGPLIQLRRVSDSVTQDFSAGANGFVDAAAIATFVGVSSATVSIWYDQGPNAFHVSQGTAASQPTYSATAFGTGLPGLGFSSTQLLSRASTVWAAADLMMFTVANATSEAAAFRSVFDIGSAATVGIQVLFNNTIAQDWSTGDARANGNGSNSGRAPRCIPLTPGFSDGLNHQHDLTMSAAGSNWVTDGTTKTLHIGSSGQVPAITATMNVGNSASGFKGNMAELVVFNTVYTGRTGLRANQKITWGTP